LIECLNSCVALRCLRHGPPRLRGRAFVHCWPYVSPASSAVSTVSALLDAFAQHLVNGVQRDVSGARATVSGTASQVVHVCAGGYESVDE
jgi:hypothetical protein